MMKMKLMFGLLLSALLLSVGCKTTETEIRPISRTRQQAYLEKIRDPRTFGLSIYNTSTGPQIRGGGRLHPAQTAVLPMITKKKETLRPVVKMAGGVGKEYPCLLDFTSDRTWLEFSAAKHMMAHAVGEKKAEVVRMPNDEIGACFSILSSLRLGQIFIENPIVLVRLADGPLGSPARGIVEPELKGVMGWDLLKKMSQIRLLYSIEQVAVLTSEPYDPDPRQVIAALPLVKEVGVCAVRGIIDGKEGFILIDPAGDFEVATPGAVPVSLIDLGNIKISKPEAIAESPGGIRIGAHVLNQFDITVCPLDGVIYFERNLEGKEE